MSMFYSCTGELFSITVGDTEIPAALLLDLKKRSPSERDYFSSSASNRDRLPIIQDADERCPLHSTTSSSGEPTQTAISAGSRTAYDTAHPLRQRSGKRKIAWRTIPSTQSRSRRCYWRLMQVGNTAPTTSRLYGTTALVLQLWSNTQWASLLTRRLRWGSCSPWIQTAIRRSSRSREFAASVAAKLQHECEIFVNGDF